MSAKFKKTIRYCGMVGLAALGAMAYAAGAAPIDISGPNGSIKVAVNVPDKGQITFNASLAGKKIFSESPLGLAMRVGGASKDVGKAVTLVKVQKESGDTTYKIFGNHAEARDHYNGAKIYLHDSSANMDFAVEFRVFDDAMAYRYLIPVIDTDYMVLSELSTWNFAEDCQVWFSTKYFEADIRKYDLKSVTEEWKVMPPLTAVLPDGAGYVTLMEANVVNYSGSVLKRSGELGLRISLRSLNKY
jgi:alpha-glucosidase